MRRVFAWLVLAGVLTLASGSPQAAGRTILVFGDSLSAAYGLSQRQGWVALLAERLKQESPDYTVVNASISGETSAGGASRIQRVLQQHRPDILVLALGANDGLRGLPITQLKANLGSMVEAAQRGKARVLLVGMHMPPNYGPRYTEEFAGAFGELARRYETPLVPFLLAPIAGERKYFQSDNLHPTAAAQPLLLEAVWKELRPLLTQRAASR